MNTCTLIDNIFTNQYGVTKNQLRGILKTDVTYLNDNEICFIATK